MEKFKNYLILSLFGVIGILLCLRQCGVPKDRESVSNVIKRDTITITQIIDRPYEVIKLKTVYYPKATTIIKIDTIMDARLCQFEREYIDSLPDSNLTIYSKIKTIGLLKSNDLSYRLKTPLKVLETKEITNTVTKILPNRFSIYAGVGLSGNQNSLNLSPFVTLNVKRASLTAGYGIVDKTYQIGVGYRLFKSKK